MKHNIKRTLALLIALVLALPTFALAEDSAAATSEDVYIANDAAAAYEIEPEAAEWDEIALDAFGSDEDLEEPVEEDAPAPDANAVVTYCFIADNTLLATQEAREGDEIRRPDDPVAPDGQCFAGWFLEDDTPVFVDADGDGAVDPVIAAPDPLCPEVNVIARFVEADDEETSSVSSNDETASPTEEVYDDASQEPSPDDAIQEPSPDGAAEGLAERPDGTTAPEEVSSDDADTNNEADNEDTSSVSPDGDPASPQGEAYGNVSTDDTPDDTPDDLSDETNTDPSADDLPLDDQLDGSLSEEAGSPEGETEGVSEDAPAQEPAAFDQSMTVSGVVVTVQAEAGVFPNNALLSVKRVPVYKQRQADAAIDEVRDEDVNVAVSYTFDIKVIDPVTLEELQPAEGRTVNVSFALAEVADENLEANVYHVTEEAGEMTAEALDVAQADEVTAGGGPSVVVETDGFSIYTVEFTYNKLEYVMQGDTSVALYEILGFVGLTGEVEAVEVSNPSLFSASNETGEWIVTARQAFSTTEWMVVTINGVNYEITVTDDPGKIWAGGSVTFATNTTIEGGVSVTDDTTLTIQSGVTLTINDGVVITNGKLTVTGGGTLVVNGAAGTRATSADANDGANGGAAVVGDIVLNGVNATITGGAGANAYQSINGTEGGAAVRGNVTVNGNGITVKIIGGSGGGGNSSVNGKDGGDAVRGNAVISGSATVTIRGGAGGYASGNKKSGYGGHGVRGTLTVHGGSVTVNGGSGRVDGGSGRVDGNSVYGALEADGGTVDIQNCVYRNTDNTDPTDTVVTVGGSAAVTMANTTSNANIVQGSAVVNGGSFTIHAGSTFMGTTPAYIRGNLTVSGGAVCFYCDDDEPDEKYEGVRGDLTVTGGQVEIDSCPRARNWMDDSYFGGVSGATTLNFNGVNDFVQVTCYCGSVSIVQPLTNGTAEYSGTYNGASDDPLPFDGQKLTPAQFGVTVDGSITGGTVTASMNGSAVTQAIVGNTVTLTVAPSSGYALEALAVTYFDANGNSQTVETSQLTGEHANQHTFAMPAANVTISATFAITEWQALKDALANAEDCKTVKVSEYAGDDHTITATSTDSALLVNGKAITLDLDGCTLIADGMADAAIEVMGSYTILTVTDESSDGDGRITHTSTAVYVHGDADFHMEGGTIAVTGSPYAVHVAGNESKIGYFNMVGGTVSLDNSGENQPRGYTVFIEGNTGNSSCILGGTISGKNVSSVVSAVGELEMYGGTISGEDVEDAAVAVVGRISLSGGTISGGTYGVKYKQAGSRFYFSGAPVVKKGIYLQNNDDGTAPIINVAYALTYTTPITVTMDSPGKFTESWTNKMGSADPAKYFTSGNSDCDVLLYQGEAALRLRQTLTIPASAGGTVTAKVGDTPKVSGDQVYVDDAVTLTVTPYDGCSIYTLTVGGTNVTSSMNGDTYTFTMPVGGVTVSALFRKYVNYLDAYGTTQTVAAILLPGSTTATTLPGDWYVAEGEVSYPKGLAFSDTAQLILADKCVMTVSNPSGSGIEGTNGLYIYAQSTGADMGSLSAASEGDSSNKAAIDGSCFVHGGKVTATGSGASHSGIHGYNLKVTGGELTVNGSDKGLWASNDITINGGTVSATGTSGAAIYSEGRTTAITINDGQVTATGGTYGISGKGVVGIYGGTVDTNGVYSATHNIYLGWKDFSSDSIKADSYALGETYNSVMVNSNQVLEFVDDDGTKHFYSGELTATQIGEIAGKTLVPADAHAITVDNADNGTVAASATLAETGDTITLTVTPTDTYGLASLKVTYTANGTEETLWPVPDATDGTKYTFAMPAAAATVTATFSNAHVHDGLSFTEWTDALAAAQYGNSGYTAKICLPKTAGNWYLNDDVMLDSGLGWMVPRGVTNLCLNGKTITGPKYEQVIRIYNRGTLNLYEDPEATTGKITHAADSSYPGVCVYNGGTFNLYGGVITKNTSTTGAGVYVYGGTFNMVGGIITQNTSTGTSSDQGGGGVYVRDNGTFNMIGGSITGNSAARSGGGVYLTGESSFSMSGTASISNNTGVNYGGGVFKSGSGTFTMTGGAISDNTLTGVNGYGGGIYAGGTSDFTLSGTARITGNSAVFGGGVQMGGSGTFTMSGGAITSNNATHGGGVHLTGSGNFIMSDGAITGNTASQKGGGVCVSFYDSTFVMSGGTISANTAVTDGGGVCVEDGGFTMSDGSITGNTANSNGGGVYKTGSSTFAMSGGTIGTNTASANGGGVYLNEGTYTMTDGTITDNTANGIGGGVYMANTAFNASGTPSITGNTQGVVGSKVTSNVYLRSYNSSLSRKITVTGALTTGAEIGVRMENPGVFTTGLPGHGDAGNFSSDDADYGVRLTDSGEAELAQKYALTLAESQTGTLAASVDGTPVESGGLVVEGDTVTLTCTPADNYALGGMSYAPTAGGDATTITPTNGVYAITMPAYPCTVTATYITEWKALQNALAAGGAVTLTKDVTCTDQGEGPLVVPADVTATLDLNGHTIDRGLKNADAREDGHVITVNGNLTITDASDPSTGKITGGKAPNGGGVVVDGGTLALESGSITGNIATGNDGGGGVYLDDGTFTMTGGSISNNYCTNDNARSGGVFVSDREMAIISVSGNPTITGNVTGCTLNDSTHMYEDGTLSNVYLRNQKQINVTGELASTAAIGVTMEAPGQFTTGLSANGGEGAIDRFTSDDAANYGVRPTADKTEAKLAKLSTVTLADTTNGTLTEKVGDADIVSGTTQVAEGDDVTLTATPATGYKLDALTVGGEDVTASVSDGAYTFEMPDSAVTVAATFKVIDYTITYVNAVNGKHGITNTNPATYTVADTVMLAPPTINRDDIEFVGWYGNPAFTGEAVTAIPAGSTDPKTFYAKWQIIYVGESGGSRIQKGFSFLEGGETATTLPGGWYVADGTVSYPAGLTFSAETHLILADGCTLSVVNTRDSAKALEITGDTYGGDLTVYGQNKQTGTLTANGSKTGIKARDFSLYGGVINATGSNSSGLLVRSVAVSRGKLTATGKEKGISGQFINLVGGQVIATGQSGHGIMASTSGSVTLGWTNADDFIHASSYCLYGDTKLSVANGKYLVDASSQTYYSGQLDANQIAAIAGATLTPANVVVTPNDQGSVTPSTYCAEKDATVNLTVEPDAGYELSTLTWTPAGGTATDIKAAKSFTKTDAIGSVATVAATYTAIPATAPTVSAVGGAELTYGYTSGSVSVTASPAEDTTYELAYQWYSNTTNSNSGGTLISGATGASYAIPEGKGAGTTEYYYCVVTATRTDNGQTAEATSGVAAVTVSPKPVYISGLSAQDKAYDGTTDAAVTGTAVLKAVSDDSVVDGLSVTGSISATFADKNVGDGKSVMISAATLSDTTNYALDLDATNEELYLTASITPKSLTVTGITASGKTYDGDATATLDYANATIAGVVGNEQVTVASAAGAFADKNVGVSKTVNITGITLTGADAGNYTVGEDSYATNLTADITAKSVTVTGITVNGKAYDSTTDAELDYTNVTFTGIVQGDTLTVTATGAFADANVGEGKTVTISDITLSGTDADNYALDISGSQVTTTASITPRSITGATVTLSATQFTYDGEEKSVTVTGVELDGKALAAADYDVSGDLTGTNAATYTVTVTGKDNYTDSATASWRMVPKPVTITGLSASSKTYDGTTKATPAGTATVSGKFDGDEVTVTAGTAAFADKNVGTNKVVTFSGYKLAGGDAGNYTLSAQPAGVTAGIAAKVVGLSWSNTSFTYDGNSHAPTATAIGLVAGDACTVTVTGAQVNAGSHTATAASLSNANYALPTGKTCDFAVARAKLSVTAHAKSKVEGAADPALTYTATGLVGSDKLSGALVRDKGEAVGTYAIRQGTLSAGGNYDMTFNGANLTITAKPTPTPTPIPTPTPTPTPTPGSLLLVTMVSQGDTSLKLTWAKMDGVDGYDIFLKPCSVKENPQLVASIESGDITSYTITGLARNRSYNAHVRAWVRKNGSKQYILAKSPEVHAYTGNGTKKIANPGKLTLKKSSMTVKLGKTRSIKATVKGVKKGKLKNHVAKLRYISSNPSVATVTAKGKVKAVGAGSCVIYVLTTNGIWKTVNITVDTRPTKVAFKKGTKTVKAGKTLYLGGRVKLTPAKAVTTLRWTSSNPSVATVDANGAVKAIKKGKTTITVITSNGKKAKVTIRVK